MSEAKPIKRPHRGEAAWRRTLAKHGASELSIEAFCQQEGISTASYYRWRNLIEGKAVTRRVEPQHTPPKFLDLGTLVGSTGATPRVDLKLDLGCGLTLHLVRH